MARWFLSMGMLAVLGWTSIAMSADAVPDKIGSRVLRESDSAGLGCKLL